MDAKATLDKIRSDADPLIESIRPFLEGHEPDLIGWVLCELHAMLLAGHHATTPAETAELRDALLQVHVAAIKQLVPVMEGALLARIKRDAN